MATYKKTFTLVSQNLIIIRPIAGAENGKGKSRYLFLEACNLPVHRALPFHVGHGKDLAEYLETVRRAVTVQLERPYFGTCVVAVVAGAAAAAFAAASVVVVVVAAAAAAAAVAASAASRSDPYQFQFAPRLTNPSSGMRWGQG